MRSPWLLALVPLLACSGESNAPAPSSAAIAPRPAARAGTIASERPFGCELLAVSDGRVLWPITEGAIAEYAAAHEAAPSWVALSEPYAAAAPAASRAVVITGSGPCTVTLGAPELHTIFTPDVADVGRAMSGCALEDVGFALLCPDGVEIPANLRFAPFVRGAVSIIDATTTEPLVVAAYRGRDHYGERLCDSQTANHTEVVRARWASLNVGSTHLAFTELVRAWFPAGVDPSTGCPDIETLHAAVWDMDGDAERVADGHDFAGAIHDGTHVLALVEVGGDSTPEHCEGANTCLYAALDTPTRYFFPGRFVRRSRVVASLGSGELSYEPELMLTNHREGCEMD